MKTVRRSNGIIIRNFPTMQPMTSDHRQALEEALTEVRAYHPRLTAPKWEWSDVVLPRNMPDERRHAKHAELLRVVNGSGILMNDDLTDEMDYGYWAFVPSGVKYSLRGTILSGMNFRVITLPL